MRIVRRLVPVFAGLLAAAGSSVVAISCGGNGSTASSENTGDSTTDSPEDSAQGDAVTGVEATTDTGPATDATVDAAMDGDATVDGGVAMDGDAAVGVDADAASSPDADASTSADADAAVAPDADAESTADADAATPADASAAFGFPTQVATTLCNRIADCCGSSADAGTFNFPLCLADELPGGFKGSMTGANLFDGGNIVFDPVAAQACLTALQQVDCTTNEISGPVEAQLYLKCYGAFSGTLQVGAPCRATIECAPGSFCLPVSGGVGDAGAIGLCQAQVGDGGSCNLGGLTGLNQQSICSYKGSGNTGLFCRTFDPTMPSQTTDASTWTCVPQEPLGTGCLLNQECQSFACPSSDQCASVVNATSSSTCGLFALDAGGG
jgi:hypothetical protein